MTITRASLRKALQDTGEFTYREARVFIGVLLDVLKKELLAKGVLELPIGTLTVNHPVSGRAYRLGKIVRTGRHLKVHFRRSDD